jgi:hypothetical protein
MTNEEFTEKAIVELFPQKGGWHYVRVPEQYTRMSKEMAERGLVPITARVGNTEWETSLLPMGDGTHFIALNAKVRKAEKIVKGDEITFHFMFRH